MLTQGLSEQRQVLLNGWLASEQKDRNQIFVLSILFGTLGVDRFMVGGIGFEIL